MADGTPEAGFAVFATRRNDNQPLIQTGMTLRRLMDDIIVPYNSEETFFIDGAPVSPSLLDRIKIIKESETFRRSWTELHERISTWHPDKTKALVDQYHTRIEALMREGGEDVTAQVIKAYNAVIKPKLKDYLPNREALLDAAVRVFTESLKALSGG
jgi:hypothetical protein